MNRQVIRKTRAAAGGPPALITQANRESLAPFVLFDASGTFSTSDWLKIGWHPHSGVATVTLPFSSNLHHADSDDNDGVVKDGGMQWMASGSGVWHKEEYEPVNDAIGIHQLWILLPPEEETAPVNYFNLQPEEIPSIGNTRVLIGEYQGTQAAIQISQDVTYLEVTLKAGDTWHISPKESQTRGFIFPRNGKITLAGTELSREEFGQLDESTESIRVSALEDTVFVLGLAQPWKHPIVHEYGQMHTSQAALDLGKNTIAKLATRVQGV